MRIISSFILGIVLILSSPAAAITICSQNLNNFGIIQGSDRGAANEQELRDRTFALTDRILAGDCDIVAVQEILAGSASGARRRLDALAQHLSRVAKRSFESYVGPSNDKSLTLGFLVDSSLFDLKDVRSHHRTILPTLALRQRPRRFARGPLEITLRPRDGRGRQLVLFNFHFKSKYAGYRDPAKLLWEGQRMESAEALRRIAIKRFEKLQRSDPIVVLLGDRNSEPSSASGHILRGELELGDFRKGCQAEASGAIFCPKALFDSVRVHSVFDESARQRLGGTHRYRGKANWIDDILMIGQSSQQRREAGIVWQPRNASDHALIYVRIDLS